MYKVMIVDDMEIMRLELKRMKLWGDFSGFQIACEAGNGHEALIKLRDSKVDLIITDIRMPVIDGVELLEKVNAEELATCVLLLSEHSEFEYARKGLVFGAFDYLVKPVNEEKLSKSLLRAKKLISEKKKEKSRSNINNLYNDVKQILELIEAGKCPDRIAFLAFDNFIDSEEDKLKIQLSVQRMIGEISELIKSKMPWYENLIDARVFETNLFHQANSLEEFRIAFVECIREISVKINFIYLGRNNDNLIRQICNFVLENVDCELSLSLIASHVHMNKNYLSEVFKNKTGISFLDYLTRVKMERAKKLLERELKTYEIAEKLGYNDTEYFSKVFKKCTGISPTEYRSSISVKLNEKF